MGRTSSKMSDQVKKFGRNVWRVDYCDHDGNKGYSYFVDDNPFKYDIEDVAVVVPLRIRIPCSSIVGIRQISKLPSNVGNCYYEL